MNEQGQLIPLSPGELLRARREQRRLTTEAVARALKVPVAVVEAIEAGDLGRFAPVYRKGYMRSYALLLGLNPDATADLIASVEQAAPEIRSVFDKPVRRSSSERWLRVASYLLASLLVGTLGWQLTHEAVRLSQGGVMTSQAGSGESDAAVEAKAAPAHVSASIAALEGFRSPAPAGGQAAWNAVHEQEARAQPVALGKGEHELHIRTSGDSWVEITDAAGTQLEMDLVRGGGERHYQGQAPFRIVLGRASAVELFMDGMLIDTTPFTSGQVVQMTLEPQPAVATDEDPQG